MYVQTVADRLAVIGCGPKAIALGIKAKVLAELGFHVPEIIVIEKNEIGGNWSGRNGLTNGMLPLGSSPLKDLGYPYRSIIDHRCDTAMQAYSWPAYLIDSNNYTDWIDRGSLVPTHHELFKYYVWATYKAGINVIQGEAVHISVRNGRWRVDTRHGEARNSIEAEGLMITGPGEPRQLPIEGEVALSGQIPVVMDSSNFWLHENNFKDVQNLTFAVLGGGESAASAVSQLLDTVDLKSCKIDLFNNGKSTLYVRNENYFDNLWFSDPGNWEKLPAAERRRFINAASNGTFSPLVKSAMDNHNLDAWISSRTVSLQLGKPQRIKAEAKPVLECVSENDELEHKQYDYIISAIGFDPLSFLKTCETELHLGSVEDIENNIQPDMSVKDVSPKLYLPMLSAFKQGIGFRELVSLGLLSDRILKPLVTR